MDTQLSAEETRKLAKKLRAWAQENNLPVMGVSMEGVIPIDGGVI